MECDFQKLKQQLTNYQIELTVRMEEQFSEYYGLLSEWNKVMNLTSVIAFEDVAVKHFLDSIILGYYINLGQPKKLIDIGSGAGFPGIPLKIIYPGLDIVLADSLNKRVRFLNEVISTLQLTGIDAVHARAEELAQNPSYREQFDLSVSRAVANLSCLSEYCLPFVKLGGGFVAYKSSEVDSEVVQSQKAVEVLGGKLDRVEKFQLPGTDYMRSFVFYNKVIHTPKKYPRKAGMPSKMPIGVESVKE